MKYPDTSCEIIYRSGNSQFYVVKTSSAYHIVSITNDSRKILLTNHDIPFLLDASELIECIRRCNEISHNFNQQRRVTMDFLRAVVTGFATGIVFGFAYLLFHALHFI